MEIKKFVVIALVAVATMAIVYRVAPLRRIVTNTTA